jgi:hypothetical protein
MGQGCFLSHLPHLFSNSTLCNIYQTPWLWSASELCRPSDRRFLAK